MGSTEGSNVGGRGIEPYEMHRHIAVVFEGRSDGEAGGEIAAGRVNQHVDLLALVFGKHFIDGLAVVIAISAFEERTRHRRQSL